MTDDSRSRPAGACWPCPLSPRRSSRPICAGRSAPAYPTRTIRVIVPFPAGGTTDLVARLFAQRLGEGLGQSVIVENMGGAGGSVGADAVAKAEPDGHTLLFHNLTFSSTTASLQFAGRARHDLADFAPISLAVNVPMLVVANPRFRHATSRSLLRSPRRAPARRRCSTARPGRAAS